MLDEGAKELKAVQVGGSGTGQESPESASGQERPLLASGQEVPSSASSQGGPLADSRHEVPPSASASGQEGQQSARAQETPLATSGQEEPQSVIGQEIQAFVSGQDGPRAGNRQEMPQSASPQEVPNGQELPPSASPPEGPVSGSGNEMPLSTNVQKGPLAGPGQEMPPSTSGREGPRSESDQEMRRPQKSQEDSMVTLYPQSSEAADAKGLGIRHWVTFMLFLGMANAYIMRTNMSVAIVAMVNHTALPVAHEVLVDECGSSGYNGTKHIVQDGKFVWTTSTQGYILSSFFYGYVVTQIPLGILAKKYGARLFLGIGMLVNSIFGLLVPIAAETGFVYLVLVRFIQGLGEGPIVPCTHAMLAKWIPPNERSRMGAAVYAGAQFGTVISMPLSGLLAECELIGGWPLIFYVFGLVGTLWCLGFLFYVSEDPEHCPYVKEDEKKFILTSLWGTAGSSSPPIPWGKILRSMPFWAIMLAHMGQNYGYETLMTELPTFMRQVLHFSIKDNGILSALPYLCMWIFSMFISVIADWMLSSGRFNHTQVRKIINSIGQYGPAIGLIIAGNTGCNPGVTVAILSVGVGLNGGIYSGFKVNHLDISPRFAGVLMAFTNCLANLIGLHAPIVAGYIIEGKPTQEQWRKVFYISAFVYIFCATFYNFFGSGRRQSWDNPSDDEANAQKAAARKSEKEEKKAAKKQS